jgi:hypothetical protein
MITQNPEMDTLRRARLSVLDAQQNAHAPYMQRLADFETAHNTAHYDLRKRNHTESEIANFVQEWDKIRRINPRAIYFVDGVHGYKHYGVMTGTQPSAVEKYLNNQL